MDLSDAFDRLEAFCAVQTGERGAYTPEAVACLLDAAEVGEVERTMIAQRVPALGDAPAAAVLLGVLLGVFASEA